MHRSQPKRCIWLWIIFSSSVAFSQQPFWSKLQIPFSVVPTFSSEVLSLPPQVSVLAIDKRGSLVINTPDGLYLSNDGGDNWKRGDAAFKLNIEGLMFMPNQYLLASSKEGGLYCSTDEGRHFSHFNPDIHFVFIEMDSIGNLYISHPILHSTNNGQTWIEVLSKDVPYIAEWMSVTPNGTMFLQTTDGDARNREDDIFRVFKSTNGGRNWKPIHLGRNANEGIHLVHSAGTNIVFTWREKELFRSFDSGLTWLPAMPGLESLCTLDVDGLSIYSILGAPNGRLFASTGVGMFQSDDSAKTWQHINSGLGSYRHMGAPLLLSAAGYLFTMTEHGIYRSSTPVGNRNRP